MVTITNDDSVTVDFIDGFGSQTLSEGDGPVIVKFGVTGDTTLAGTASVAVPYTTSPGTANDTVRYTSYYHDEDFTFEFEVMSNDNKITFTDTGVEEIGFDFEYYGQVYTHYRYEGNGYIVLSNGGIEAARLALLPDKGDQNPNLELSSTAGPLASGLPIIAPFWDTFIAADPDTTGYEVLKEGDDGKYLIIQPSDGITDVVSNIQYQIVLFENTNQIEFRYRAVSALTMAEDPTPSSYGASATIGIKDATGEFGTGEYIQFSYNAAMLSNDSLIRFVPHIDYRPVAGTVILTADHPEATIEIPLVDDGITEGDEQFTFESLLFDSAGTITITDDDPGIIEIPLDLYRVEAYENNFATVGDPSASGVANLRVRTEPPLVEPFTLQYTIEFGSASADDLLATPMTGEWELVGDEDLHDFYIYINNDDDPELVENFFVDLSIPDGTSLPPGYSLLPGRSEVTIADNDLKLVGFDELSGLPENTQNRNFASAGLAIGPSGEDPLGVTITLHYEIENGTAIEGEDGDYVPARVVDPDAVPLVFIPTPGKLTGTVTISPPPPDPFTGGPGLVRPGDNFIPILVIYDDIVENNETYTVRLFEPPEGLPSGFELYRDTVELTIFNDDKVKIGFEAPVVTVNENETAELSVAILSTTQIDEDWELTIGYRVSEDSALSGHDYTGTDGTLTFSANMTKATVRIPIIDDDIFEGANSERFVVTLFDPVPFRTVPWLSFEPMEAEVMIVDNDAPEIRLLPENIRVIENAGTDMTLRATIPFPFDEDLELTLATFPDMDPNTLDSSAYELFATTVIIPMGDTSVAIGATVSDNIIAGFDKVLLVGVTHLNHAGRAQSYEYPLAARPSAAVTIVDDDTLVFNLEHPDSVPEGHFQVCSSFSNPFEYTAVGHPQILMLEFRVSNPDSTSGELYYGEVMDRNNDSYTGMPIPFAPIDGDVQLCADADFENEYYEGQRVYKVDLLGHPDLHESIILGNVSSDVTIVENDPPELALNYDSKTEITEGQTIEVELELTNGGPQGLHEPLTVRLALTTTSSASTSDVSFPTFVTIPRGKNSVPFKITARDDMLNNEGEQFELALVSVTPATAVGTTAAFNSGGAIAISEVKLPQITLSASPASVAEGNLVQLIATLTDPLVTSVPEELTLELVADASSTADTNDYGTLGDIVIPMNGNTGMVTLMIESDDLVEFAETLKIRVAQLGYGSDRNAPADEIAVDVTITSDDTITATIMASDTAEGQMASVQIGLNLDLPTGVADNEVKLVLVGTDRGNDVTGSSWNVGTDLLSNRMATVEIPLVTDSLLEGPEQVYLVLEVSNRLKPLLTNDGSALNVFDITDVFADLSVFEGEMLSFDLDATSLAGSQLTLAVADSSAGFDFAKDIVGIKITQDSGGETTETSLPANVQIAASTRVITLTVEAREDILVEPGEEFTLNATPSGGSAVTTKITLRDPIVEVGFSVTGMTSIDEDETTNIDITLSRPLTQFLKDLTFNSRDYLVETLPGSNYVDISGGNTNLYTGGEHNREFFVDDLGFDFEFYGQTHRQVAISANGFLRFSSLNRGATNTRAYEDNFEDQLFASDSFINNVAVTVNDLPIAAPFWDDLDVRSSNGIFTELRGVAPNREFIVQYTHIDHRSTDGKRPRLTFQVVLFENGKIEFRYVEVGTDHNTVAIGITDGSGTKAGFREVGIGTTQGEMIVQDDTRVVFTPRPYRANAVTKNADNNVEVASFDIRDNIAVGTDMDMFTTDHQNNHWDGDRTYTVELDSNIPLVVASGDIATYTVNDDDDPVVVLERADGNSDAISIEEGSQIELVAKLMNAPDGAPEDLLVNLDTTGASSDYDLPDSVTIATGAKQRVFTVTAKPDDEAEFDEMLTVEVGSLVYGSTTVDKLPTPNKIDTTIPLNDKVAVTGITASNTNEGDVVTVRVSLNRALPANTANGAVMLVLDGTDRTNDVTGSSWDITSDLSSSNSAEVMITLTEDTILEGDERVTLNLMVDSALDDILPAADRESGVSFDIIDDEDGTVSIDTPGTPTYSEAGSVMLTVELPTGVTAGAGITVNYEISFPTVGSTDPAESADVVSTSGVATIDPGDNSGLLTIALNDDVLLEETELFRVTLTSVSTTNGADVMVGGMPVDLMILDDETLTYSFDDNGVYSEVNAAYTVQLKRLGQLPGSGGGATVPFTTSGSGSSPASVADFDAGVFPSGSFVFTGYAADSALITLPAVKDDEDIEGDETLRITLTGRTETYDVTLADNDVPLIDIERVSDSGPVAEGASVQFRARLVNGTMSGATEDLTVNLAVDPTDSIFAVEVSFPQSSVTIMMGMSEAVFTVNVTNDELTEFAEVVRIQAESVDTTTLGKTTNAGKGYDLEISSNDPIVATISVDDTTEGGMARARITLDRLLPDRTPADVLSLVLLSGGTTNADVRIISKDITTELETSLTTDVMIELIDNPFLDGDRTVRVMLRIEPGMSPDLATLLPDLPAASFEIIDDEQPIVRLVAPPDSEYYESAGGNNGAATTVDFEFKLPEGVIAANPIKVYYSMGVAEIGSGSETAYGPGLAPGFAQRLAFTARGFAQVPRPFVTILPGKNSVTLTVTLPDDDKAEVTELLTVRLDDVETAGVPGIRVDTRMDETVITILDDEDPVLQIIGSGEINEDDGSYMVQLRRLGRIDQDGKIPYTIVGQGADEGDFVSALTGDFEFDGYEPVSKQVILILNDDNSEEESKPFQISIENPMTKTYMAAPIMDPVTGMVFTSITLIDSDVADFFGALPPTGGPVLPVWLLLVLLLTGVALLVPALRRI